MPLLSERWKILPDLGRRRLVAALSPTQLFVLSFAALIAVGTAGLLVIPGLYTGARLGVIDALFMATSAVCVTGLIVVDTATYFTGLGQAWIALLIQLGGLGILTFTTLVIMLLGRRTSVGLEEATSGYAVALRHLSGKTLVRAVVLATLAVELVGAVGLWTMWRGELGAAGAVWPAVFHAISAFCNAGFSVFSDSLVGYQRSPGTLLLVAALVVIGGLGFVVFEDVRSRIVGGRRPALHTRLAMITTVVLLAGGTVLFLAFEWRHTLRDLAWPDRISNALFMAVTPRTAGFNSVEYTTVSNPSMFLTILLMLIGGSPGSTAGGLKTTTVTLLVLLFVARLRGVRHASAFSRTVPDETVQRAAGLAVGGLALLGIAVFLLLITELPAEVGLDRGRFLDVVFEAHSAFGTVGLSLGGTPALTPVGKLIVSALMVLGRVGPATAAAAMVIAGRRRPAQYRFAHEDVVVG